jgi:molecular chaperone DnaK
MVYDTEKLLKEHAEKLDASSKSAIESAMSKVKSIADGDDAAAIEQAVDELNQAMHAFSKHMYEHAAQAGGGAAAGAGSDGAQAAPKEDVIDAEFEKKD